MIAIGKFQGGEIRECSNIKHECHCVSPLMGSLPHKQANWQPAEIEPMSLNILPLDLTTKPQIRNDLQLIKVKKWELENQTYLRRDLQDFLVRLRLCYTVDVYFQ